MKLYKDWINTENYFIFLYHNNIINEQKINTYLNVPISIYNKKTVSVASYKFNTELIKLLKIEGFLIKNITYGDCEFSLRTNSNNIRFYDLYFEYENKKIVVEFNGTYWHKNKEERDNEKMNLLKQNNINGFVILEEDYNKTGTIPIFNKIKDLLNENKKN
jgi:ribosomal protein S8